MKKTMISLSILGALLLFAGCSQPKKDSKLENDAKAKEENILEGFSEKDVVSEEEIEIDGEKYVQKTFKNGESIQMPAGTTLDDIKAQQENGDPKLDVHSQEITDEDD